MGFCGQAPSNLPEFATFLVECGIDAISLNPDSFLAAVTHVPAAEALIGGEKGSAPPPATVKLVK